MVEHLSCKQKVMGSIPIVAFHIFGKKSSGVKHSHSLTVNQEERKGGSRKERKLKREKAV